MMRPRELFGVGIRVLAIWFWCEAFYWGYFAVAKSIDVTLGNPKIPTREEVSSMLLNAILGTVLMVGARALVWLAYGDAPKAEASPP